MHNTNQEEANKRTLVCHPTESWALLVRNRVDSASEDPLTTEELMLIALNTALIEAREALTNFKP